MKDSLVEISIHGIHSRSMGSILDLWDPFSIYGIHSHLVGAFRSYTCVLVPLFGGVHVENG